MKTLISSEDAPPVVGPYSPGLSVGEWIFLAGMLVEITVVARAA
jgi:enamine deaminase RidA (YjgF/YER057c/UK114 family)